MSDFDEDDGDEELDLSAVELTHDGKLIPRATAPELFQTVQQVVTPELRLSVSLIKDYDSCPAKAYARITRQKSTKTLSLINGSALHQGVEEYIKHRTDIRRTYTAYLKENADKNKLSLSTPENVKFLEKFYPVVDLAKEELDRDGWVDKLDPSLVEVPFEFRRNGRLYLGKIDAIDPLDRAKGLFSIVDLKTGKTVPSRTAFDADMQYSMYYIGAYSDPKLPTFGKWPTEGIWWHARGKNVAKREDGTTDKRKGMAVMQYKFKTVRTLEEVEQQFVESIEPAVELMEEGRWRKVRGAQCDWCSYFDKIKQRCTVELPKAA